MSKSQAAGFQSSRPHSRITLTTAREMFAAELFDTFWDRYRQRVCYVATYEQVIHEAGATFVNDHIAFRTLAVQEPLCGISNLSRLFEALGYRSAGCYNFPDKHLSAIHFQHPNSEFPKLFISELKTWELSAESHRAIAETLEGHRDAVSLKMLADLAALDEAPQADRQELLANVVREFHELPWQPPEADIVQAVNNESQYAAWVLVHGYNVNHFTSLVNSHGNESLNDIEKTIATLQKAGVPVKDEIEGARGSKLRQSATAAAVIDVDVRRNGQAERMPWTYAYFELAERGVVVDQETGQSNRFEGFLGPQATQLFEMTRLQK